MNDRKHRSDDDWGGNWTEQKLKILESYLDFYTTALKNKRFHLLYIDAFAGKGEISYNRSSHKGADARKLIEGSARRAINIDDKPFDKLIFVEKDEPSVRKLIDLKKENKDRDILVHRKEANAYLRDELQRFNWRKWRGVLFLDPFATSLWQGSCRLIVSQSGAAGV